MVGAGGQPTRPGLMPVLARLAGPPRVPIDGLTLSDIQRIVRVESVHEKDEVLVFPSGARHDKTVETEEMGRISYCLCPRVIQFRIPAGVDFQRGQRGHIGKPQGLARVDPDRVQEIDRSGREDGCTVQMKEDLGVRTVRVERRVEDIENTERIPSCAGGVALQRVSAVTYDPPNVVIERFRRQRFQSIEKVDVARFSTTGPTTRHGLQKRSCIQPFDRGEDFFGPVLVNKVDRPFAT